MNKTLLLNLNNNAMNQLQSQINELESYIDKHELKKESVSNSTVAWQIEHSLLTLNMIINAVKKSNPNEYKWSLNMNRILVMTILKKIPRGRAKAPKIVQPTENISIESLKNHIEKARENILLLNGFEKNNYFEHPFFGKLNLKPTIKFLGIHTNHHLEIIRDIVK
jgi:hypothetical protein